MRQRRVVLDTNVIFSSLYSRAGAAFRLVSLLELDRFQIAVSVPLLFEYEDVLFRHTEAGRFRAEEIRDFLDFLCSIAHRQNIFFLWRPYLPDPKDDQLLELAVAAGCDGIVTYNLRDFAGVEKFAVALYTPKEFLGLLEEAP